MLNVIHEGHPLRAKTEQVIRDVYLREHGAKLDKLPQWLVAKTDAAGGIACAASLRFSADGFFSDCYLDRPIEQVIGGHVGLTPNPTALVEVGSLVASHPGDIRLFIQEVIDLAKNLGMQWAFFTATARLRAFLRRGGLPLIELAVADPARVENLAMWGDYYRQDPRVMLVGKHMINMAYDPAPAVMKKQYHA